MKVESWLFLGGVFFFTPVGIVYGFMVEWQEPVGFLAMFLLAGMSFMVGWYLLHTSKRVGLRPEDRVDGDIHENAGAIGMFAPWCGDRLCRFGNRVLGPVHRCRIRDHRPGWLGLRVQPRQPRPLIRAHTSR